MLKTFVTSPVPYIVHTALYHGVSLDAPFVHQVVTAYHQLPTGVKQQSHRDMATHIAHQFMAAEPNPNDKKKLSLFFVIIMLILLILNRQHLFTPKPAIAPVVTLEDAAAAVVKQIEAAAADGDCDAVKEKRNRFLLKNHPDKVNAEKRPAATSATRTVLNAAAEGGRKCKNPNPKKPPPNKTGNPTTADIAATALAAGGIAAAVASVGGPPKKRKPQRLPRAKTPERS